MTTGAHKTRFASPERLEEQAIRQQKEQLESHICSDYFSFFPLPIMVVNANRQIVFSNQAFVDALGTEDVHSFLGKRPGEAMCCAYAHVEENWKW